MEGSELRNDVDSILETTKLCDERSKLTKELSGGTKRKLSLAMALIGGS
jgi:ATP-binding cassette subfamily A (ABC1) protein 3